MSNKIIVLAGATGKLGTLIAQCLAKSEAATVRALVRPGSAAKAADLKAMGAEVIELALDGSDSPAALAKVMQGAFAVVSALQGGPEVIVGTQSVLLDAAIAGNVRRFIPSDYAIDFTKLPDGSNRNFDTRIKFHEVADAIVRRTKSNIEITSIFQGAFTDLLASGWMLLNFKKRQVQYFGSPDTKMDFTTWENTAEFTAAAALDPNPTPRSLNIAGARLTPREVQQVTKRVVGADYGLKRVMSLGMLKAVIAVMKFIKPGKKGDLMPMWVGMQYAYCMAVGLGSMGRLDNDRYPGISWEGIESTIARAAT